MIETRKSAAIFGADAMRVVNQYAEFGLKGKIPMIGKGGVTLSRCTRLLRDQLDQPWDQRQALRIVRGKVGIARLAVLGQVTDHRDRANRLVFALQAPRGDGGVVQGAVEREVHLHVPAQTVRHS